MTEEQKESIYLDGYNQAKKYYEIDKELLAQLSYHISFLPYRSEDKIKDAALDLQELWQQFTKGLPC